MAGNKVVNKTKKDFTIVSNKLICDPVLSGKAKWVLIYMLSRKEGWEFYESEIAKNTKDGLKAVRAGIKELLNAGYIVRHQLRDKKGFYGVYEYHLYDTPGHKDKKTIMPEKKKSVTKSPIVKSLIDDPFLDDCDLPTRERTQYDTNRLFRDHVDSVSEMNNAQ